MILGTAAGWLEPKAQSRFHGSDSWGDFRTPRRVISGIC
jgi:hypothetical protein